MDPPLTTSGTNNPSTIQVLTKIAPIAQPTNAPTSPRAARVRLAWLGGEVFVFGCMLDRALVRCYLSAPVSSTARKAFWGMSTLPIDFIRFLPAFCLAHSFRLRVMSPP